MTPDGREREAGFALLIVLSMLLMVAVIAIRISAVGRSDARIAANLNDSAMAESAADGAVFETIGHLMSHGAESWTPNGKPRHVSIGRYGVVVRAESENGKINPNIASAELLQALMVALKVDAGRAKTIADAIINWRTPALEARTKESQNDAYRAAGKSRLPDYQPFAFIDDVGAVLGMTPDLLRQLTPYLTLYTQAPPNPADADPLVADVLRRVPSPPPAIPANNVPQSIIARISAEAAASNGGDFKRVTVAQIDATGGYKILAWHR